MLTIFSIPKPFHGHIGAIQENAIQSWLSLKPACQVILFGDEEGVAEAASKYGARHVAEVATNEFGTPLLDHVFKTAQQLDEYGVMCYVNADIILLGDFLAAVQRLTLKRFLMVGQRWDLDVVEPLDFGTQRWTNELLKAVGASGVLHPPWGSDYFVFRSGGFGELPSFAVGRPGWDNWMIYHARATGMAVVDATQAITVVHQNHDYSHVPSGKGADFEGPEADVNRALAGPSEHIFTLVDANWILDGHGLHRRLFTRAYLERSIETARVLHPRLYPLLAWRETLRGLASKYMRT